MSMRPRLNWFSPLPPTRSQIAHQTLILLPELARRADLTIWSNDTEFDPRARKYGAVKRYDVAHPPWREIADADATFDQIGNDPRYHTDIWHMSRRHPGIVILHDIRLQHLFAGLVKDRAALSRGDYLDMVERHHSTEGRECAESFLEGRIGIEHLNSRVPLFGAAVERSLAAIVHSESARQLIATSVAIPTSYLYLCANVARLENDAFIDARRWEPPYRLILFGFLNPNRRVDAILKALASFPERHLFRLDIYGTLQGAEQIAGLIDQLGVADLAAWRGYVSEKELDAALRRSHLALNLRYPTVGEASGTQLHIWQYALPSLVSRLDWYATLPEDTVGFVRPQHETEDIHNHLRALLRSPQSFREMGLAGRVFVNEHCTAAQYADGILQMVARVSEYEAIWIARDMAQRAGRAMSAWCMKRVPLRAPREIQRLMSGYVANA